MLGLYQNFPEILHKIVSFAVTIPDKKVQRALVQTFQKLNNETFKLEDVAYPSLHECIVVLEFGIAEADNFNYLDKEEATRVLKNAVKSPFQVMDFLCAVRYYKTQGEKRSPLRFDYYMLRFAFNKVPLEMQVFHERGPRHVTPEDIVNLIVNRINELSSRKIVKVLPDYE